MKPRSRHASIAFSLTSLAWLAYAGAAPLQEPQKEPTADQIAFFESKIRPVLADNCFSCHGPKTQMAGLRLDTLAGLEKGEAIVKGDVEKSKLVQVIRHTGPIKMPMGKKLKAEEIANIEAWVQMGAPWPKSASTKPEVKQALWSLVPVKKPVVPTVKAKTWVRNPVDSFVLAKIETTKLQTSKEADKPTLLRRLSYDLTGLPPTAAEMDAFIADKSPTAYEKVVDRLLASPRYGERWARHWLDVARYADTKGYVFEEDRNYPNAYTYRDWVIEAFNKDLPYDQFVIQQLAADRLPEVQNGDDKRPLAAMGFLTVGRRFLNNSHDIIDDRIDVTTRGFMGFTVSCARCHDHKFDPIPAQDYYSMYAVFASSLETTTPISEKSIRDPWEQFSRRVEVAEKKLADHVLAQIKLLREKNKNPEQAKSLSEAAKAALQTLREDQFPAPDKLTTFAAAFPPSEKDQFDKLTGELESVRSSAPKMPEFAMAMGDSPQARDGVVFKRGNPGLPGDPAPRRFLAALSSGERESWKSGSGRLELAKSIASKTNPLTARVFVNRVWQHHFGAGLVRTPSDFGFQGEKPTHPELLDYLASWFVENGWSVKKLHRLIVTSATYRQASSVSKIALEVDPENRLLSRVNRRRLDMEQMRDSILLATGRLDLTRVGGKSVEMWTAPFSIRRSVYGFIERQNLPGVFKTFDFASPDTTSPRRFMTTVPQQALFFMNSPFSVEQARFIADRKEFQDAQDDAQRVRLLYRRLFARLPNAAESAAGLAYLKGLGSTIDPPLGEWRYGYGAFDASQKKVTSFTPLSHFAEGGYRVGPAFPDPKLGYLILNAQGGHPGRDASLSVIRRWIAPADMTIKVQGALSHQNAQGDGVRGRVVSSRTGVLGEWTALKKSVFTEVNAIVVHKGDTIDFVVDCIGNESFDAFGWAPVVMSSDGKQAWNASGNFGPPPPPPVSRFTFYAQALMMTNEFMFVD